MQTADFLVIGGGIIGINVARELKRRHPDASVVVLEKEARCGSHASGRNSGVLHAGFYYTADSLKARFARDGNRELHAYCEEKDIPVNRCGKLVVAGSEREDAVIDELLRRGERNGVPLQLVGPEEVREIEPRAITLRRALFSPSTASVDPRRVLASMERDAADEGVRIERGCGYRGRRNGHLLCDRGPWQAGFVVNAAGLYADRVAHDFGFSRDYRILPFKGLYLKSSEPAGALRTNIYPVPDLEQPFLGVHFTVQADGGIKVGPTAIPALWREQYRVLDNFRPGELLDIGYRAGSLFARAGFDFRRLAFSELRKYSRRHLLGLAARLARGVELGSYRHWAPSGIRAQLVDMRRRRLEMDFVLEGDGRSMHILNAVSPGFTCSLPFSRHVCDEIAGHLH